MKEEVKNEPNIYGFYGTLKPKWSIEFAPNCFIHTPNNYNWFHRLMQRLILGFKWKRI
jgi:hypothetical protein